MPAFRDPTAISPDALAEAATSESSLGDFGSDSYRPGLEYICEGLSDPGVRNGSRQMMADEVVRYLANRLRIVDWHRQHPGAAATPIEAPLVILGLPRTGTTALSYVLDCDPQWRCLLNWEAVFSIPPPTPSTLRSDPRCRELLEFQEAIVDSIDPPPPHWEWADGPTECTFLMAGDCRTIMWDSRLPNDDHRRWLLETDMVPAYELHKLALQALGSQTAGTWCLKMPAHALFIDALLRVYPDARIVWTHRDPVEVTASFLNLTSFSQTLTYGESRIDVRAQLDRLSEQVARPMRALAGRSVHHVHYADWMADPLGQVRSLYDWLEVPLTESVAAAMQHWLDRDPLVVSRQSRVAIADFDVSPAAIRERFDDYTTAYGIESTPA